MLLIAKFIKKYDPASSLDISHSTLVHKFTGAVSFFVTNYGVTARHGIKLSPPRAASVGGGAEKGPAPALNGLAPSCLNMDSSNYGRV